MSPVKFVLDTTACLFYSKSICRVITKTHGKYKEVVIVQKENLEHSF